VSQLTNFPSELTDSLITMMTLEQVRYFLALCNEQSFSRAARHCGIAQPSLTIAIRRLEAELGSRLVDRGRRTSHLSGLGMVVQPHLVAMVRAAADAREEAAAFLTANSDFRLPIGRNDEPRRTTVRGRTITKMDALASATGGNLVYAGYPYDPYA
jgi:molybdenum-dependent DNA-binding transcriptional regulator ModE